MTLQVILEKSGLKRNSKPFAAPGNVTALIHITIININNKGINIFVYFSMPSLTPENTIQAVNPINTNCHIKGLNVDDLKLSKTRVVF